MIYEELWKREGHRDMIVRSDISNTFQIVICDDNPTMIEQWKTELHKLPELKEVEIQVYTSGKLFLDWLEEQRMDMQAERKRILLFSDIEMPEMDGVTLGKRVYELYPDSVLVFVTSHPEYAIDGYTARAFRYLLKPVSVEMVQKVLKEIKREWNRNPKLLLQLSDEQQLLDLRNIVYISAEDKYTMLYTVSGKLMERTSLQEFEDALEMYGFVRVHRKHIVNLRYHKSIEKGKLQLSNGQELPLSRRREGVYRERLMEKLERELIE